MKIKDLIKLILEKNRLKEQFVTELTSDFHINMIIKKTTIVEESIINYDKNFLNFITMIHALSIYKAIHNLYDIDNTEIDSIIFAHMRILMK